MKDYECHITVEATDSERSTLENFSHYMEWKFSFITGDPDFGSGNRVFLTKHYGSLDEAIAGTNKAVENLEFVDIKEIKRKKIELIIADTKAGTWPESPI